MTMLETPASVVGTSWREWDVRVRDHLVQVSIHDTSTIESHDSAEDPRTWAAIPLRAEHARGLALEVQDAARQVEEDVLSEWGLD